MFLTTYVCACIVCSVDLQEALVQNMLANMVDIHRVLVPGALSDLHLPVPTCSHQNPILHDKHHRKSGKCHQLVSVVVAVVVVVVIVVFLLDV